MKGLARRQIDPVKDEIFKKTALFTVGELAEAAGLQPMSIKRYCKRLAEAGKRPLKADGHITNDAVERIMNPRGIARSPVRPAGWLTVKALTERLKVSKNTIYRRVHSGELRAFNHKGVLYIDPESAERLELERKYEKPLIGWELVASVRAETGRTQQALDAWIKRHNIPIRLYLHPHMNKAARYMPTDAADAYRALAGKTDKYIPNKYIKTHAEPHGRQHVSFVREESREEQPAHALHSNGGSRHPAHHHPLHAQRRAPADHHADRQLRGSAQTGRG
jgi:excisionase family DNA binding protein